MTDAQSQLALNTIRSIPRDADGPVFEAPWQAEIFAITLSLHEQHLFTWNEWADQLSRSIKRAQAHGDQDLGDTYYLHWLDALENMIVAKGIGNADQLTELYTQWESAAANTPHGESIVLPTKTTAAIKDI